MTDSYANDNSSSTLDARVKECSNRVHDLEQQYATASDVSLLTEVINLKHEVLRLHPPDHPDRALACANLAKSLRTHYFRTDDEDILVTAIDLDREAVSLRPPGHPDRYTFCANLSASLTAHYDCTGDEGILAEMIDLDSEALSLRLPGHLDWHVTRENLVESLRTLYSRTGDENLLYEATDLDRQAFSLKPPGHSDRHQSCMDFVESLLRHYDCIGDVNILVEVINLEREVLLLHPVGHPDRPTSCSNLAVSLAAYYSHTGDEKSFAESINLDREALSLRPPGHPDRHRSCTNLAVSLATYYDHTGDENILAEAIGLGREALLLWPPGLPDRDVSCANLAASLVTQYNRTGDENILTEAIDLNREALSLRPLGHPNWPTSCASLAASLATHYDRTGDDTMLIEAIELEREALALEPPGHPNRHLSTSNLAVSLAALYNLNDDERFLAEATHLNREALLLRPPGHPDRPMSCSNLAASLTTYYRLYGDGNILQEAIDLDREALSLRPPGHPDRHTACENLAGLLELYYAYTGDGNVLTEAVDLYSKGAAAAPLHEEWRSFFGLSNIHLMRNVSFYNVTQAAHYLSQGLRNEPDDYAQAVYQALMILDSIWKQYSEAITQSYHPDNVIYRRIITLLPMLSSPALELAPRFQRLRDVSQVGVDAFVSSVLAGDYRTGLEHLEVAQGMIWAQLLHQRDPQFRDIPDAEAAELELCLRILSHKILPSSLPLQDSARTSRDDLHKYSARMYAVIRQIRQLPGLDRFMLGETYETLCQVSSNHIAVVLVGARDHFYALILAGGRAYSNTPLKLDLMKADLDFTSISATQSAHRGASVVLDDRGLRAPRQSSPLNRYLQALWNKVVLPVLRELQLQVTSLADRPRLYWCPTGPFTSIPLHAAGIYDGPMKLRTCCADYVVSSYTPTLTSLLRSQRAAAPSARRDLTLMLLAEHRAKEKLPSIPGVATELRDIATVAVDNNVQVISHMSGSTTITSATDKIQVASIVHLACHGIQDPKDATTSGFCLGDGRWTISELMRLDIKGGFLAFLSACETAKGSEDQPDQAMHLAAAMLFAGFKSVVATMWAISDEDGPKVAKWFYENLFAREVIDADAIAYALDHAVGKLRDSGVPSHQWVPFIHMGA